MMTIKPLKDIKTAEKIGEFLTSTDAFTHNWYPGEKESVKNAIIESLKNENHQYWYSEENGKIIGAIGVRENHCQNGGYEMDEDYIAVHKDHRRKGIASQLLKAMEEFVIKKKGRYIHILTCDIESYIPARSFYEARNFQKAGEFPDYYNIGEGRVDYFKVIK